MRTIKFRAWDSDDKEMYEPMVLAVVDNGSLSLSPLRNCKDGNRAYKPYHPLMQFTGLLDKNGKEIYEGDTYKDLENDLFVVVQMDCGRYALKMIEDNYVDEFIDWSEVEITGNIHES